MADPELTPAPPRPELFAELRARLVSIDPRLRFFAEGVLGADARIDGVAVDDASGAAVLLLIGGPGEDLELVGRAVAQRAWVEARLEDWLKLAPELGLRPEAGVRVILACPGFRAETLAAARALGAERVQLARYQRSGNGDRVQLLLEPRAEAAAAPAPSVEREVAEPPLFRSGLSDAQLALTAEEKAEFES